MRAAFKVATSALKQASSPSTATSSASAPFSLSNQLLRQGYASKAGQQPPTPPSSTPSSSASTSSSSSNIGKPVTKHPNSESPVADPDRFKDTDNIPGRATTETFGQKDAASSAPKAADEAAADSPAPVVESNSAKSTGKDVAPLSGLASQYLDATEVPMSAEEARRTGARAKDSKRSLSSIERKRRMYGRVAMASTLVGAGVVAWHMGREWDTEKEKERLGRNVTDEQGLTGRWQRGQARFMDTLDYFNKPAWDPLLPDPLPPPHQKPYTLVISLDDLLIHSQWDREHGWRTAKRPGVDYFLAYLSQFYEIVLFTAQPAYTAIPIVDKLDPHMIYILYKLFRDSTRYHNKAIVKDLSYLGRDLSKVIMLDTDPEHFQLQPENAYQVPKWKGNRDDTDLIGMIPFLEAIAFYHVPDVRPVLKKYADKHIPTAWAEVEREQKAQLIKEWEEEQKTNKGKLSGGFASMFGLGGSAAPGRVEGPPKTALENFRELSQKAYMEEQKYWDEHKGDIEKAMEEDRKKQMEQMQSSVVNLFSAWAGVQPPPKPEDGTLGPAGTSPSQPTHPSS